MSRPHDSADMCDLLLDALDETARRYERSNEYFHEGTAVVFIETNGHRFAIAVHEANERA
jgi:hypothetical protein